MLCVDGATVDGDIMPNTFAQSVNKMLGGD